MTAFDHDAVADKLAVQLAKDYPLREKAQESAFLLTPEGVTQQAGGTLHKFRDGDDKWSVTFGATFLTLETSAYTSHNDFIPRLVSLIHGLKEFLPLQRWDRFGYRYTNRISDEDDMKSLDKLFVPEVLGTLGLDFGDRVVHNVSETVFEGTDASLLVKSAFLPPNASIEPTLAPIPGNAWILDLDSFINGPSTAFGDAEIEKQATTLSLTAHEFFGKVITDDYRARFIN
jgi:uncharacterized protein (TIGR04255 family)